MIKIKHIRNMGKDRLEGNYKLHHYVTSNLWRRKANQIFQTMQICYAFQIIFSITKKMI
jgi:hypothetical protein